MAERILRSPGITTREIDLSAPGRVTPQGIPAGIIGTAQKGPAFVPVNFATANDFANIFGATEGKHFGAMAVNEWMRNARSGVFLRVLGAGDCKKSGDGMPSGATKFAGMMVGTHMRDKDRIGKTSLETDGSADRARSNPYAGSGTGTVITLNAPSQGTLGVPAANDQSKLTVTFASLQDGDHFVLDVANASGALTKHMWWISTQRFQHSTNATSADRIIADGSFIIQDGATSIDLEPIATAHGVTDANNIHIVDLLDIDGAGSTTGGDPNLATAIEYWINAARVGSTVDSGGTVSASTQTRNNIPVADLNAASASSNEVAIVRPRLFTVSPIFAKKANGTTTSTHIAPSIQQQGATLVTAVAWKQAITFTGIPTDGSILTITDSANTAYKIGFKATGNVTAANYTVPTTGAGATIDGLIELVAEHLTGGQLADGVYAPVSVSIANLKALWDSSTDSVVLEEQSAPATGVQFPATAKTEENIPCPESRMYFLSAPMFQEGGIEYFGQGNANNTANAGNPDILRGVLMFPSGVIPGIGTDVNSAGVIDNETTGTKAYDEYGATKDAGGLEGCVTSDNIFRIHLNGFTNTSNYPAALNCSFDSTSPIYLGKVLNTDPTKIQEKGHYLYAHYPIPTTIASVRGGGATGYQAGDAKLTRGTFDPRAGGFSNASNAGSEHVIYDSAHASSGGDYTPTYEDWRAKFQHAYTPWIKSQSLGNGRKKLFRFWMLDAGVIADHAKVKISIANISKSTDLASDYGSFDVLIRSAHDTDMEPVVLQQFSGCNLNPSSDRYVARVIGDVNTFYDFEQNAGKQKLVTEGLYPNKSQYVRIEMHSDVENGSIDSTALPLGFAGKHHLVLDGRTLTDGSGGYITMKEPPLPMRHTVSVGTGPKKVADSRFYWGVQYQDIVNISEQNQSTKVIDLVDNLTKWFPALGSYPAWVGDNAGETDAHASIDADSYQKNEFSLENVLVRTLPTGTSPDVTNAVDSTMWHEAIYIRDGKDSNNTSGTPVNGDGSSQYVSEEQGLGGLDKHKDAANGYRYLDASLDFGSRASKKYYKFTVPMQGGWDGHDLFDQDKSDMNDLSAFREMDSNTSTFARFGTGGVSGPTTAAFRKGLDILAEKSDVDIQLLATPGLRSAGVTDYAIDKTEDRFDALYLMDTIPYDHDNNRVNASTQETSVTNTVSKLSSRNLDTSFAAAYFPDVVLQDGDNNVVAPPSVAVLGAMSLNDAVAHPWYAPAGFARGALATTLETQVKLNRSNMDSLYDADINPITALPQSGDSVVIFGQKTLLQAQSALDRVNVRRLLIDIRRKVRTVANQILFEPNREATLARFSALVNPILGRVQAQQGLDRYKVVIDTTTTTQQDVENNTIRGKIFLQPTRSIEFISLDFVVTNQGAEI